MPLMPQLRAWPRPGLKLLDPLPHRPIEPLPLARVKPAAQLGTTTASQSRTCG
jgi:hypothetical protein